MRLNQVTVPARDVPEAVAFYTLLGLRLIVDNAQHYARFECSDEQSTFSVELSPEATGSDTMLYFECDVDTEYSRLTEAGVAFEQPPTDQPWLWREAYLRDPSGNRVCLYAPGNTRRFPPWRIDGRTA